MQSAESDGSEMQEECCWGSGAEEGAFKNQASSTEDPTRLSGVVVLSADLVPVCGAEKWTLKSSPDLEKVLGLFDPQIQCYFGLT
ncbi:hypothetical protein NDU88_000433 [Pleurodeles waltl]|uniref:Uncharacterized protein n=1 Tax=Pleurodeles waltl TaxID=8319 RepID=A0AAV7UU16_PLEWA|nr:hypothetical protein NDU88_000433 [Pleurodeles waltl]